MLLVCGHQDIELMGVTTVVGNQTLEKVTHNALSVARIFDVKNVPFAAGCSRPLTREVRTAANVHGESGLDGPILPQPVHKLSPLDAVDLIITLIMNNPPKSITLVPTGVLTNIAMAARKNPAIIERVKEVVLMGGAVVGGNVTACSEFNIRIDPEAADIVFRAGWPVTMIGLDVTHKALAIADVRSEIEKINTGPARFLNQLLGFFQEKYHKAHGFDYPPIHDPCALAYVICPEIFTVRRAPVMIETRGQHTTGMTVVDLRKPAPADCLTQVGLDIDSEKFWQLIYSALSNIQEGSVEASKIY